ncbi:MAG: flagellar biosynthetic protein FliO [Bacteroidetes bacterium]|nr:flagellar biosynthetic protein FliO [Bacteroidota bacterium]MCH8523821.1 flagellar biosynthetic protein FliO [Balneolales bacterium]
MDLRSTFPNKPPKKVLSLVIGISGVMLLLWLLFIIRMGSTPAPTALPENEIDRERLESVRSLRGEMEALPEHDERGSNIISNGVTTFFVLVVLIGGAWLWLARKGGPLHTSSQTSRFAEKDRHMLGPGQYIQVMEINNEIWVMGITNANISLLHRYDKDEWNDDLQPVSQSADKATFLEMFKGKQS